MTWLGPWAMATLGTTGQHQSQTFEKTVSARGRRVTHTHTCAHTLAWRSLHFSCGCCIRNCSRNCIQIAVPAAFPFKLFFDQKFLPSFLTRKLLCELHFLGLLGTLKRTEAHLRPGLKKLIKFHVCTHKTHTHTRTHNQQN